MICANEESDSFSLEEWVYTEALGLLPERDGEKISVALVQALVEFYEECVFIDNEVYLAHQLKLKDELKNLLHTECGFGLTDKSIKNFLKYKGYLK
jgi:hypothetical protein